MSIEDNPLPSFGQQIAAKGGSLTPAERRAIADGGGYRTEEWAPEDVQRRHVDEGHGGNPYDCPTCAPFIVTRVVDDPIEPDPDAGMLPE